MPLKFWLSLGSRRNQHWHSTGNSSWLSYTDFGAENCGLPSGSRYLLLLYTLLLEGWSCWLLDLSLIGTCFFWNSCVKNNCWAKWRSFILESMSTSWNLFTLLLLDMACDWCTLVSLKWRFCMQESYADITHASVYVCALPWRQLGIPFLRSQQLLDASSILGRTCQAG